MLIEQIIEFEWRGLGPLAVHTSLLLQLLIFIKKTKPSRGLLFTAKILQEAMCLTSLYLGQITYII